MTAEEYGVPMFEMVAHENVEGATIRLYVNDVDVSDNCTRAFAPTLPLFEAQGWADVIVRNKRGYPYIQADGDVVLKRLEGVVWWECA
jgi:hypothetical protein